MGWGRGTHGDRAEEQEERNRQLGEIKKEQTELALGERELFSRPENERIESFQQTELSAVKFVGGLSILTSMNAQLSSIASSLTSRML